MSTKKSTRPVVLNVDDLPRRQAPDFVITYANNVRMRATFWDFTLLFGQFVEVEDGDPPVALQERVSVTLSPAQAKALAALLNRQLASWERDNGPIPVPPASME